MQKQQAQERLGIGNLARAQQRAGRQRRRLPAFGQERRDDLPLLIESRVIRST
jgi:hypothetical protein